MNPTTSSPSHSGRRVVVTGLGAVTPLGLNQADTWAALLAGRSGVGSITQFDTQDCPVTIAGEVKGFDAVKVVGSSKDVRKMGRFTHLAVGAGREAFLDSGLESCRDRIDPTRMGVNIGVGMGGLPEIEEVYNDLKTKGYRRITPFFIPQVIPNLAAGQLSIALGLKGPNLCITTACASGAHAIGESARLIRQGVADVMLAGGSESVVCAMGIGGFAAARALSTRNESPEKASRPYDRDRDGFVMGEGAGALVLEEFEHARKRGARIYAEIRGYGLSGDAYHITLPSPEGEGGFRAMKMALEDGRVNSDEVGYVNAHGTSTPAGDTEEARAIARLFPHGTGPSGAGKKMFVSSTKSMTGHLLGAAGALEAVVSTQVIHTGKIPPTINLDHLDPECDATGLHFTPHHAADFEVRHAVSNSFGFGGTNVSLLISRV